MNIKTEDFESPKDQLSLLENFLEQYQEKLEKYGKYLDLSQLLGYMAFLTFLFLLIFRVMYKFTWFSLSVPAIFSSICLTIYFNLSLSLKDLYDDYVKNRNQEKNNNVGSILSYFCLNFSELCFISYLILTSLKLDQIISLEWSIISIPFYLILGVSFFYLIFITPAFLKYKFILELIILYLYLVSLFVFITYMNMKLENEIESTFLRIFIPLIITFGINICLCVYHLIKNKETNLIKEKIINLVCICLLTVSVIITSLILDHIIKIPYWSPVLLCFITFLIYAYDVIVKVFFKDDEDDIEK